MTRAPRRSTKINRLGPVAVAVNNGMPSLSIKDTLMLTVQHILHRIAHLYYHAPTIIRYFN